MFLILRFFFELKPRSDCFLYVVCVFFISLSENYYYLNNSNKIKIYLFPIYQLCRFISLGTLSFLLYLELQTLSNLLVEINFLKFIYALKTNCFYLQDTGVRNGE